MYYANQIVYYDNPGQNKTVTVPLLTKIVLIPCIYFKNYGNWGLC